MVTSSMEEFYELALSEGEGLGTAYEYYVKQRILRKLLRFRPRTALIYGLPEKYGYSLDLVKFCNDNDIRCSVYEKGPKLERLLRLCKMHDFMLPEIVKKLGFYDILLSSEVLQRKAIPIHKHANDAVIFVPNGLNKMHTSLRGLSEYEMRKTFPGSEVSFIDMPPFPPGGKLNRKMPGFLTKILELYSKLESIVPGWLLKKRAHIIYVVTRR